MKELLKMEADVMPSLTNEFLLSLRINLASNIKTVLGCPPMSLDGTSS